jgi:hypothetical protein
MQLFSAILRVNIPHYLLFWGEQTGRVLTHGHILRMFEICFLGFFKGLTNINQRVCDVNHVWPQTALSG